MPIFEYCSFFYVLSFFKKGDTIQGGTLFKEIRYLGTLAQCGLSLPFTDNGSIIPSDGLVLANVAKKSFFALIPILRFNVKRG
jgi:hypothetical protein